MNKLRKIIGWILASLLTAFLLYSVTGKLTNPGMQTLMAGWGLEDWVTIIAIGEAIAALLFLFPKTNLFGTLLLSSHMGGAIVIHMSHGDSFTLQAAILVLVWICCFIRNPHLLKTS
ncbi:MAG: DoxX family protein [Flavobacteriales bacterium]|nr:DoxX family protein [Flavobacteriales bacterium]